MDFFYSKSGSRIGNKSETWSNTIRRSCRNRSWEATVLDKSSKIIKIGAVNKKLLSYIGLSPHAFLAGSTKGRFQFKLQQMQRLKPARKSKIEIEKPFI